MDFVRTKQLTAVLVLGLQSLQHTETKLSLALNCNYSCVREFVGSVSLEFDAFFEINQVQLHFGRRIEQSKVSD
ncbi:MAG: hypothetical protein A3I63_08410 [Betaproteobacteria bacterium RIFCSPLOWO2_02_FULL_66_14]|nr:MAG: hypothetical protein A3I63_08410 [Betaproteobacteria bacterium RIFCSPLOWO2_02_FULL_66_14]